MKKVLKKKRGFSMIEMILYMGILGGFLVIMSQVFIASLDTQVESETASAIQQDGRFILARLSYDIARAQSITSPATFGEAGQDDTLQITITGEEYTFNLSSGNLQLTNNSGSDQLNGAKTTVSNLNFVRLGNAGGKDTVQIEFTLTSTGSQTDPEVKNFQTAVGLR